MCVCTLTHVTEHFTYAVTTFNCNFWYICFSFYFNVHSPIYFAFVVFAVVGCSLLLLSFIIISLIFFSIFPVSTSKWHIPVEYYTNTHIRTKRTWFVYFIICSWFVYICCNKLKVQPLSIPRLFSLVHNMISFQFA